jgi:hypothetical protein
MPNNSTKRNASSTISTLSSYTSTVIEDFHEEDPVEELPIVLYFLRITPSRESGDANQNNSFHAIDTGADQIFDQRPFLNRVGKQTITMGCPNKQPNLLTTLLWLKLSKPVSK